LIACILNPNPRKRYSIQDIKEHSWFMVGFNKNDESATKGNSTNPNLFFEFN